MRLANVSFRYGRRAPWVLKDVHLDLPEGTVAEVAGRNGAGKSTLLRLMAGVARPARGSITGRPPVVGYAPEIFPTAQPFTVSTYLAWIAGIRGAKPTAITPWVERLGMTPLLDTPLTDLSKGSAQKVGLAQALLASPGLLILDEPFSGLDRQSRAELPLAIEELRATGAIIIVSDHQNGLADLPRTLHLTVENHTTEIHTPENHTPATHNPATHGTETHSTETQAAGARGTETRDTETQAVGTRDAGTRETGVHTTGIRAAGPHAAEIRAAGLHAAEIRGTDARTGEDITARTLAAGDGEPARAVIEVRVEPGEAEAVLGKLRAEGYQADLREDPS
ncbi:ABC transporter ATP-binding protein [Sphaerisporangium aureirubrum]|uniref:ATP-binding cassette domain-containing protein n=1 Tax=Sphaerisporangium aureirubrum TaxID=1544736 RepID=A0ABW1NQX8_9ACTN